jgi:transcriptional regulator with XRE-family HTH domain
MATKSQHSPAYERLRAFLRRLCEEAGLTQRQLGDRLKKPQSWVYNCETANRRVDVTEFIAWAQACGVDAQAAFQRFLELQEQDGETGAVVQPDAEEQTQPRRATRRSGMRSRQK